jgi:hypothetical protein
MLNLDDTSFRRYFYKKPRDVYLRVLNYSSGAIIFVSLLRAQIAEINLVQLLPGFYYLLLFICLIIIVLLSDALFRLPREFDQQTRYGSRTLSKLELFLILKFGCFILVVIYLILFLDIVPLSFDSLDTHAAENTEGLWSFGGILILEIFLSLLGFLFAQIPIVLVLALTSEKETRILAEVWQNFSFVTFIISGMITPTLDAYTQLTLAFSVIGIYLTVFNKVEKRSNSKHIGVSSLVF